MTKSKTKRPKRAAVKQAIDTAKAKFDDAHRAGMDALERGDYDTMGDAIKREREAIRSLPKPKRSK
jgi:hypothetical protein